MSSADQDQVDLDPVDQALQDPELLDPNESHRGGFGDFGGQSNSLIDRNFRERIILVGVSFPPHDDDLLSASLDELELLVDTAGADVVGRVV